MCTSSLPTRRRARPLDCRGRELDSCRISAAALGPNNLRHKHVTKSVYKVGCSFCANKQNFRFRFPLKFQFIWDTSPLQDERRVGLAVSRVMYVDGVSCVGCELAERALAAAHALSQSAAGA